MHLVASQSIELKHYHYLPVQGPQPLIPHHHQAKKSIEFPVDVRAPDHHQEATSVEFPVVAVRVLRPELIRSRSQINLSLSPFNI